MGRLHDVASTCTETVCQFITLYVNHCHDVCYDIYPEWEELIRDWTRSKTTYLNQLDSVLSALSRDHHSIFVPSGNIN